MPDISMCDNEECKLKKKCYRHEARPDQYQSYSSFNYKDGKCDYYWEIEDEIKT